MLFALTGVVSHGNPARADADRACLDFAVVQKQTDFHRAIYENFEAALNAAEICHQFSPLPLNRERKALKQGQLDGTVVRILQYGKSMEGAVEVVPERLGLGYGSLVTFDESFLSLTPDQMEGRRVARVLGYAWSKRSTAHLPDDQVQVVQKIDQLYPLLKAGRVDGILIIDLTMGQHIPAGEVFFRRDVMRLDLRTWVASKNVHRIDEISDAIRAHKNRGYSFFRPLNTQAPPPQ